MPLFFYVEYYQKRKRNNMTRIPEVIMLMLSCAEYNPQKLNKLLGKPKTPEESFLRNMELAIVKSILTSLGHETYTWPDINGRAIKTLAEFRIDLGNPLSGPADGKSVIKRLHEVDGSFKNAIGRLENLKGIITSDKVPEMQKFLEQRQKSCRQCLDSTLAKRQSQMSPERVS